MQPRTEFALGDKWRARVDNADIERFVHLLRLDPNTGKVDLRDARIVRKSFPIKVVQATIAFIRHSAARDFEDNLPKPRR